MNYPRDDMGITDADFRKVFKYGERSATVLTWLNGEREPKATELMDCEWRGWLHKARDNTAECSPTQFIERLSTSCLTCLQHCPCPPNSDPGVYIILAKHGNAKHKLLEKSPSNNDSMEPSFPSTSSGGQRHLQKLPFSESTFRYITNKFYIHGSVGPIISRADVPVFSHAEVYMADSNGRKHLAHVYNCRTSNTWANDLAVTVTYLPTLQKTFCIMFGCDDNIVEAVQSRLFASGHEMFCPLIMPGILVELERTRHVKMIDRSIGAMETKIAELDSISDQMDEEFGSRAAEQRNYDRRTAWLDTAYLKNGLMVWNTQLEKLRLCVTKLDNAYATRNGLSPASTPHYHQSINSLVAYPRKRPVFSTQRFGMRPLEEISPTRTCIRPSLIPDSPPASECDFSEMSDDTTGPESISTVFLRETGEKMARRIEAIEEEYAQKIGDCAMRLEGMSMATQWAQGETNMAIAMATSRDSQHMRFIALVTMVYLPGTFFAGVFSMSFFNWQESNTTVISSFFWIYVLFTVSFTILTVGSWWYFVVYRPRQSRRKQCDKYFEG